MVLVRRSFWRQVVNFDHLVDWDYIAEEAIDVFEYADDADGIITGQERHPAHNIER